LLGVKKGKRNSYIVLEDKPEEFLILNIKPSDKYGYIFELQSKKSEEPLIATGNGNLRRLMDTNSNKRKRRLHKGPRWCTYTTKRNSQLTTSDNRQQSTNHIPWYGKRKTW